MSAPPCRRIPLDRYKPAPTLSNGLSSFDRQQSGTPASIRKAPAVCGSRNSIIGVKPASESRRTMPLSNPSPVELLILQSTPFCNLDCGYCYFPNRSDRRRMGQDVLALVADHIVRAGWLAQDAAVVWHAGEPLVVPPDYYDAAIEMLDAAAGRSLSYGFQSNGTLIDDAWIDLFQRRRIH